MAKVKTRQRSKASTRRRASALKPKTPSTAVEPPAPPATELLPAQETFCLEWLKNGYNAGAAYLVAHPGVTKGTAYVEGSRYLRNPKIAKRLGDALDDYWRAQQMSGEEAAAGVALDATLDVRAFFDDEGKPLKPHQWPDAVAGRVKGFEVKDDNRIKLTLVDPFSARVKILELTGKIKGIGESIDSLAAALRADQEKHGRAELPPL